MRKDAGGDKNKRYFLIGPKQSGKPPKEGFGLILVLPGGDGSEAFHPFVKRIFKRSVPGDYLVAQLVAAKWTPEQEIVWPTRINTVKQQKFTTEQFIEAVVADVRKEHPLNKPKILTLSWSSGGPAAYATSLESKTSVTGSFVAMSVFTPEFLPPLKNAAGHAYYLYHSPRDKVCPFFMAQQGLVELKEHGGAATLVEYKGGHGWRGDVFGNIRKGIRWLDRIAGKVPKTEGKKTVSPEGKEPPNLIRNGGFEQGVQGWIIGNNSKRSTIRFDPRKKTEGKQSLRIAKKGGLPVDIVRRNVPNPPKGQKVSVSAMVSAEGARNAWLKFFIWDARGKVLVKKLDVARISGTFDWKKIEKTFTIPQNAKLAAVQFWMVMGGTVWLDDVRVSPIEPASPK